VVRRRAEKDSCVSIQQPNDIEFSGERKRVRCNEGLGPDRSSSEHSEKQYGWDATARLQRAGNDMRSRGECMHPTS
jgi:hypothetical protein